METGVTSMGTMSSMITESIVMTIVKCPRLPRGAGRTCLSNMKTGSLTASEEVFQSTPGSQALMRDLFSCRAWSTETELTEMAMTEIRKPAIGCMSLVQSASAELPELR